jgi:hypothetical protein
VGDSHFGIYSSLAKPELHRIDYLNRAKDISIYLLRMIDYGLQARLDLSHQRVAHALALLQRLKVINCEGGVLTIADEQALLFAKKGISPIESKLILSVLANKSLEKQVFKHASLAIFMCVCLHTKESIRKHRHEEGTTRSRPTELWRKGGYIESCLAVITEC